VDRLPTFLAGYGIVDTAAVFRLYKGSFTTTETVKVQSELLAVSMESKHDLCI